MADSDSFLIEAGDASACMSALGAECRRWRIGAREMLWPGDARVWPGVAPVLFPTCGWSRDGQIRIGGTSYPMPVHGFAAQSTFVPHRISTDAIRFTLDACAATRRFYPFEFQLAVTYRLTPAALHVGLSVTNLGVVPMPYACGLHPGFTWDRAAGAHRFTFDEEERPDVPVIASGGLFSARQRQVPMRERGLDLTPDLFASEALCFLKSRSHRFALRAPDGTLQIDAPDFPHLILWNTASAPFLAIESWTGTGDLEGFEGDFHARPSMIHLAPGAERTHAVAYRWQMLGTADASP